MRRALLLFTRTDPGSHWPLPAEALPKQAARACSLALDPDRVRFNWKARGLQTGQPKFKSVTPWAPGPARSFQPCSHLSRAARAKIISRVGVDWACSSRLAFQSLMWALAPQKEPLSPGKNDLGISDPITFHAPTKLHWKSFIEKKNCTNKFLV